MLNFISLENKPVLKYNLNSMSGLIKEISIITLIFLLAISLSFGRNTSKTFIPDYEKGQVIYKDKKSGQIRSQESFSLKKEIQNKRLIYKFYSQGKGNYDEYKDVQWTVAAEIEEKNDFLYPLYSIRTIRDNSGVIAKIEKRFDYDKKKIYYRFSRSKTNAVKKKVFPIKGKTCDSTSMTYFLKKYIANIEDKTYKRFYLLSDKANLYKITLKVTGYESLNLPIGKIKAIKVRLIPHLGLLSGLAKVFIPPTYLWYTKEVPFNWLQYQGLETGLGSAHIIASLCHKDPAIK